MQYPQSSRIEGSAYAITSLRWKVLFVSYTRTSKITNHNSRSFAAMILSPTTLEEIASIKKS